MGAQKYFNTRVPKQDKKILSLYLRVSVANSVGHRDTEIKTYFHCPR